MSKLSKKNYTKDVFLTIAVPTFNRVECLKLLLDSLLREIDRAGDDLVQLEVLICDNCSTDGTSDFIKSLSRPEVKLINHDKNYGGGFNVRSCFGNAKGIFVWILGDDDLPLSGSLIPIIKVLKNANPDLLYLRNRWINSPLNNYAFSEIETEEMKVLDKVSFIKTMGAHFTFISSMIVNKHKYLKLDREFDFNKYEDTNIPHMAWTLPLINNGDTFACSKSTLLLARGGNSGGYAVAETFGVMLSKILKEEFEIDSKIFNLIYKHIFSVFLPIWIWRARFSENHSFSKVIPWDELEIENLNFREYKLFIKPLKFLPKWLGLVLVAIGRVYGKLKL